jgi:hypothetical protein
MCSAHSLQQEGEDDMVASGTTHLGCTMHINVLSKEYSRVEVLLVSLNHLNYEVEIPAPDGEMVLGNLVGYFIAWQ